MKRSLEWLMVGFVVFVFVQSLFFKFTGSEETEIIFNTIGAWMSGISALAWLAQPFSAYGGVTVGAAELIASILLVIPRTRIYGALIGLFAISGAIFFHLFTPLGVNRAIDSAGNTDGGVLFFLACGVWVCCVVTLYINRIDLQAFPLLRGRQVQA